MRLYIFRDTCHQNIDSKIIVCDLTFVILRFVCKISCWLSYGIKHFSVFHSAVYYHEVVLFIMP